MSSATLRASVVREAGSIDARLVDACAHEVLDDLGCRVEPQRCLVALTRDRAVDVARFADAAGIEHDDVVRIGQPCVVCGRIGIRAHPADAGAAGRDDERSQRFLGRAPDAVVQHGGRATRVVGDLIGLHDDPAAVEVRGLADVVAPQVRDVRRGRDDREDRQEGDRGDGPASVALARVRLPGIGSMDREGLATLDVADQPDQQRRRQRQCEPAERAQQPEGASNIAAQRQEHAERPDRDEERASDPERERHSSRPARARQQRARVSELGERCRDASRPPAAQDDGRDNEQKEPGLDRQREQPDRRKLGRRDEVRVDAPGEDGRGADADRAERESSDADQECDPAELCATSCRAADPWRRGGHERLE